MSDARFMAATPARGAARTRQVAHVPEDAGWRPWTVASVVAAPAATAVRAPAPSTAVAPRGDARAASETRLEAQELERLRREAREAAAAQGRAEGRAEGLAQGRAEGYEVGVQAGRAEAQAQAARLLQLLQELPAALARADARIADALAALALDIARQVIGRSLQLEPGALVPLVHSLLAQEPSFSGNPRLVLHPLDAELVRGALGAQLEAAGWQVRADEAIGRGGCQVLAASGACDATVETRTRRVAAALALALDAP